MASAFEHIFISSKPEQSNGPTDKSDFYHSLPLTLKMQRPDLSKIAFGKPGISNVGSIDLEIDSEFMAIKLATTNAQRTAGLIRTAAVCVGNGIWEVSPNNMPFVDTVASLISIPIFELEKSITYDIFRRFRVCVSGYTADVVNEFVLMQATISVPDFSESEKIEKTLHVFVVLSCNDKELFDAASSLLGKLPLILDDDGSYKPNNELARLLYGVMKDAIAASYLVSS